MGTSLKFSGPPFLHLKIRGKSERTILAPTTHTPMNTTLSFGPRRVHFSKKSGFLFQQEGYRKVCCGKSEEMLFQGRWGRLAVFTTWAALFPATHLKTLWAQGFAGSQPTPRILTCSQIIRHCAVSSKLTFKHAQSETCQLVRQGQSSTPPPIKTQSDDSNS